MQGVIKLYDPTTGAGIIVRDDDRSEVFLRPGSLKDSIFRTLRQGQRVNFSIEETDDGSIAVGIHIGSDGY